MTMIGRRMALQNLFSCFSSPLPQIGLPDSPQFQGEPSGYAEDAGVSRRIFMLAAPQMAQGTLDIIEDIKEFSAYVVEVDRLIAKFNFDRNPTVVNENTRGRIDNALSLYTMTILRILRMKGKDPAFDIFVKDLEKFVMWRIKSASPRARAYVRRVLRESKWTYPIPF